MEPLQTVEIPVIDPGLLGTPLFTATARVDEGLLPHMLIPYTVTFPLTADAP